MVNRIAIALPCAALALLLLGACGGEHASYFPTEAGMPLLEAGRVSRRQGE